MRGTAKARRLEEFLSHQGAVVEIARIMTAAPQFHVLCKNEMNREIEFHDSTLKEIIYNGDEVVLCFDEAYVHHSEGIPGLDKGTGWVQRIDLVCHGVSVIELPDDLPNDLDFGFYVINNEKTENMMKLPFETKGEIEIVLITQYGKRLQLKAKSAFTKEVGKARYIEDFHGI